MKYTKSRRPAKPLNVLAILVLTVSSFAADKDSDPQRKWSDVSTPHRAVNITAIGDALGACGTDEMIMVSQDGGETWEQKHENRDGEILLNIAFVDERIGHAAGTGGLLLATQDGGQTWKKRAVDGTIRGFSFSDVANGIVIVSKRIRPSDGTTLNEANGTASVHSTVMITRDGGDHWEELVVLKADDRFKAFSEVLSVATLDARHYLVGLHQPEGEDNYAVTQDGGKTWTPVHPENTFAGVIFVHRAEYWAFGIEYLDRKNHGGYSAPVTLHSKDGQNWMHGIRGSSEYTGCTVQGCYLWDGTTEDLYGEHEKFYDFPQDSSLTTKWAVAANRGCTISDSLKCTSIGRIDTPRPRPERNGAINVRLNTSSFAAGCLECNVRPIKPDPALQGRARVSAEIAIRRDGSVRDVTLSGPTNKQISTAITEQLMRWLFEPAHEGTMTVERIERVPIDVLCSGWPGRPETNTCILASRAQMAPPSVTVTPDVQH